MSTKSSIHATAITISLAVLFLLPQAIAHAGIITINDATENISFTDTTGRVTSSNCAGGEVCTITFSAPLNVTGASGGPLRTNIFEDSSLTVVSDTLAFDFGLGSATLTFTSDPDTGGLLPLPNPAFSLVETGSVQIAAGVTWFLSDETSVVDTIAFISDIDPPPSYYTTTGCDSDSKFCGPICCTVSVPRQCQSGACPTTNPAQRKLVDGFRYSLSSGNFTAVETPPPSFGFGPVNLFVGGTTEITTTLNPGDTFDFISSGLNDVSTFLLNGITPLLDTAAPGFTSAFPTVLHFDDGQPDLLTIALTEVSAIPEPGTVTLIGASLAARLAFMHRRKSSRKGRKEGRKGVRSCFLPLFRREWGQGQVLH